MKRLFTIIIITFISLNSYAHKQETHQYIVREAYKLLKLYVNTPIINMNEAIGNSENGGYVGFLANGNPWIDGKVVSGAFREDEEDVIYGYGDGIGDLTRLFWSSVTHFWDADAGDDNDSWLAAPTNGHYPNAFVKLRKYAYGGWEISNYITTIWGLPNNNGVPCATQNAKLKLAYISLPDMYKNKRIYVTGIEFFGGGTVNYNTPILLKNENLVSISVEYLTEIFTWEILGRMCHLLADMSVPAHVHSDVHAPPNTDPYEDAMAYGSFVTYWDFNSIWNTYHTIWDPEGKPDPLRYLMYDLNQLSDHFGSRDVNGDDNIAPDWYMIPYYPYNIQPANSTGGTLTEDKKINIRNSTFPHAIMATAGLLYWFANEADLLPHTIIKNDFEGGSLLINGTSQLSGYKIRTWNNTTSVTLQAVDQIYANCNRRFLNWQKIENGVVIQTYNTRSITINPSIYTTYKANFTSENYFFWNVTGPTKGLYRGESRVYNINPFYGNPPANYYWHTEYRNIQNGQVYWSTGLPEGCSIYFSNSGKTATFSNNYFSKYCGSWADSVIRVYGTVQPGACGCSNQTFFEEITLKDRTRPGYPPPPPPPGGCPYVYIWNGDEWIEDNNILPQSQDPSLFGQNIIDYYQLFNKPVEEDGKYYLAISEYEEDRSFFDQFKLLVIDHPQETFITVDDSGSVIQFAKPAFFANAQLDSNDVYKLLYSLDDIKTEVSPSDTLSLSFENVNSGTEQWLLLVGQVQAVAKEKVSGKIVKSDMSGKESSASFTSFRLRKNPTFQWIVAPVSNTNTLQIDIAWQEEAEVDYTELSNKIDFPFTLCEAELFNAVHSVTGDIINEVTVNDGITSELNKNEWIELSFSIPPQTDGTQRSFIFVSNGRYVRLSNKSSNNLSGKNQLLKNVGDLTLPLEYKLAQNYPNPFNPSSSINYSIKDAGNVRLKVYDIIGNEVGELVNQNLSPGNYSVEFNANDLPSGVYIYTIQVNNFFDSKKMLLIK